MNSVPHTVVSKDGTRITFDRYGDGSPLIFVDGATADRSMDVSLATVLAPHFTVFAYDRRGRGDSGDTPPFAVEREIEDLDAIITTEVVRASVSKEDHHDHHRRIHVDRS